MRKKVCAILLAVGMLTICLAGCGDRKADNLEGTCTEILDKVYANAELSDDFRDALQYYETSTIDSESAEYMIGTADVKYTDSVYSAPMMSSVAYQCILLRVAGDQDMEQAKRAIKDNADPRKWVCVEAESTIVDNVGDVILFIMADKAEAEAIDASFKALAE